MLSVFRSSCRNLVSISRRLKMSEEYVPSKRSTFLYFAYGSNLWTKRIHLQNSSAVRKGIAQLTGYRLDFGKPGEPGEPSIWNGAAATIVEDEERSVWGAVYEIDLMHLSSLDIQEGVHIDYYVPLIKEVKTPDGEILECRTYQMVKIPPNPIDLSDPSIPHERKPSKTYIDVILRGADECQLPEKYFGFLKTITHNGCDAHPELLTKLYGENQ